MAVTDLQALLFGGPPFERHGAPEPSLLPHLARLIHDHDAEALLRVAELHGVSGVAAPPWYPLWEAVIAHLPGPTSHGEAPVPQDDTGFSGRAYRLPSLPEPERTVTADQLADELAARRDPPWFVALAVSRIAPFCSPDRSWPGTGEPLWDELIDRLATQPWPDRPHGDVLRAHPFAEQLDGIRGRHETSASAIHAIGHDWTPRQSAAPPPAGPEPSGGPPSDEVPPPAPPPPSDVGAAPPPMSSPPPAPAPSRSRRLIPWPTGVWRRRRRHGEATPPDDGPASPPQGTGARHLQADVYLGSRAVSHAFVAGSAHTVEVSIGHLGRIRSDAAFREPEMPDGADRVPIRVRFWVGDRVQEQLVQLPRDIRRESTVASFVLDIAEDAKLVTATIVVYDGAQVLEAAVLAGPVVPAIADEDRCPGEITLTAQAWIKDVDTAVPSSVTASLVVDRDRALTATRSSSVVVDLPDLRRKVMDLADRIDAGASLLHQGEDELERLLRDLAIHGRELRTAILADLPDEVSRSEVLQVVAAEQSAVLPLELVYDGPQPTAGSKLCPTWREALEQGRCPTHADAAAGSDDPSICPLRFWGLSKVIERHAGLRPPAGAGFEIRSERTAERQVLRALDAAVLAASELVDPADLSAALDAAHTAFGRATTATDWASWLAAVADGPPVLIALPHHALDSEVDPPISALELGKMLLRAGALGPAHIGPPDRRPGPLVVLLGCNTGFDDTPIHTFAGEFRLHGASVVVSTLGLVIPEDAAEAVRALVTELAAATRRDGATVGQVILRTRRRLLADGLVLGLLVVANGDADWRFAEAR